MKQEILPLVQQILEEDPRARDDYLWLYLRVGDKLGRLGFLEVQHVYEVLRQLPSFTTIERARRMVADKNPHLHGVTYNKRKKLEKGYREVKGNVDRITEILF